MTPCPFFMEYKWAFYQKHIPIYTTNGILKKIPEKELTFRILGTVPIHN